MLRFNKTIFSLFRYRSYSLKYDADLVVIGGGIGGFVSAVRAAQLGMKVICVGKNFALGGTFVCTGMPLKSVLTNSYYYHMCNSGELARRGTEFDKVGLNFKKFVEENMNIVSYLSNHWFQIFLQNDIKIVIAHGKITGVNQVTALKEDGSFEIINTKNIIIATGSEVKAEGIEIDEKLILSSIELSKLKHVHKRLIIIGACATCLETGLAWSRLGSEITVIEISSVIGAGYLDEEISQAFQTAMSKERIKFKFGTKVTKTEKNNGVIKVNIQDVQDCNKTETMECDILIISSGRKPYTKNLGLQEIGIQMNEFGSISVNKLFQTDIPNIYAIGDCVPGPMVAGKAYVQGIACVEGIKGGPVHVDWKSIPFGIFTFPEIGWIGRSEQHLKREAIKYKVTKFPVSANHRANISHNTEGFVKVLTEEHTGHFLGIHIIGPCAIETINQAALAVEYGGTSEDIARVTYALCTYSNALRECCTIAYFGKTLNI